MKRVEFNILTVLFLVLVSMSTRANVIDSLESPRQWLIEQQELGQKHLKQRQEFKQAIEIFESALNFANSQDLLDEFPEISVGYGIALYKNGDIQNSYSTLKDVLPRIPEQEYKLRAEVNQILGMNLVFQDKFSEGYKHQMEALKFFTDIGDNKGLMSVYYDLGSNFASQAQYEMALENYEKGIALAKSIGDTKMTILGITAIGGAYANLNDFEKALNFSDQSIELAESINDQEELGWASINRGYLLGQLGRLKESEYYLKQSYDLSFVIENRLLTAYSLEQLSIIYLKDGKLDLGEKTLAESFEIYRDLGQVQSVKSVYKIYADLAFEQKDFEKYKKYTEQYITIKDSIYSQQMMEEMSNLKEGFEIHKIERENEIALLKKDQELKMARNYATMAFALGAAGILILLLSLMYFRNKSEVEKNEILREKNAEILRQIDILAASNQDLEKFAYIISHDLKEPLRNINGFTKLLMRKLRDQGDEVKEYANFIVNGTQQMEDLLSGLLDYSKLNVNKGEKEKFDANKVLLNVIENLSIQLEEKNCKIEFDEMPQIQYRKSQLTQVFQNLIANAIKFGKPEGNQIAISCIEECDFYKFKVTDKGIGIDPKYLKTIFVVFQRLHDRGTYSGSGIGLATCKKIVEDHGGSIWAESELGKGSSFYFTVPKECKQKKLSTTAESKKSRKSKAEAMA